MAYDPRTGKKLGSGTVQDFSKFKGTLNYDSATGQRLQGTKPITTDQLQPTQPFNLKLPTPKVPSSGLESAVTGSVEAYKTQGEQERAQRELDQKTAKNDLSSLANEIMGTQGDIGNVGNTVDRTAEDTARKEADRFTSEIEAEQLAIRRKTEALRKNNPQGLFGGALEQEVNRLERDSLSKQADLAILQNSALRNYTTAKDIADREVQNKLEPLKVKLENLKFFYQENKELFNKEDERLYNEKIKSEERAYQKEENLQNQIMAIKLEAAKNGAPTSVLNKLSSAKTFDEALKYAGSYNMSIADRAKRYDLNQLINSSGTGKLTQKQTDKLLTDPTSKATAAMISVDALLNDYKKLVSSYGGTPTRTQMKEANSYLTNVLGPSLAVAQGQGALQKDEADRLIDSLGVKQLGKREKVTINNIDSAIRGFQTKIGTNFDLIDSSIPGATDNFEIFKKYKLSSMPPVEQAKAVKIETVNSLHNAGYDDNDILEYLITEDPTNANTIQTLFNEGYTLEEIMQTI